MSETQKTMLWSGIVALVGFGVFQFIAAEALTVWLSWLVLAIAAGAAYTYWKPSVDQTLVTGWTLMVVLGLIVSWFARPRDGFLVTDWTLILSVWLVLAAVNYGFGAVKSHETLWQGGAVACLLVAAGIALNVSLIESFAFGLTGMAVGLPAILGSFKF